MVEHCSEHAQVCFIFVTRTEEIFSGGRESLHHVTLVLVRWLNCWVKYGHVILGGVFISACMIALLLLQDGCDLVCRSRPTHVVKYVSRVKFSNTT